MTPESQSIFAAALALPEAERALLLARRAEAAAPAPQRPALAKQRQNAEHGSHGSLLSAARTRGRRHQRGHLLQELGIERLSLRAADRHSGGACGHARDASLRRKSEQRCEDENRLHAADFMRAGRTAQ